MESQRRDAIMADAVTPTIQRSTGVTPTERYLGRLADRSFLTLWSYASVYRDQGLGQAGQGKELCDLLVVFEDHVLIFSDKDVQYGDSGDDDVDWARWYKRAVRKSADQTFGAERWLREHPDRVFLDRECAVPFPFSLPAPELAKCHRIVVAHDSSGRRRRLIGGSGSLMINPSISGAQHLLKRADGGRPFVIGQVAPDQGYVHVLDDASLEQVLGTLDTITDFIWYLEKKERLIRSGRLAFAYGEEDLLAFYLKDVNGKGEHDFVLPNDGSMVLLEEGHYTNYLSRPEVIAKRAADGVSALWDAIIEEFATNVRDGTLYHTNDPAIATQERILRFLAREPRVRRRMLSRGILEKMADTPADRLGVRVLGSETPGDPLYVFISVPEAWASGRGGEGRLKRARFLEAYCRIMMMQWREVEHVIGIATESGVGNDGRSYDLALLDRRDWTAEDDAQARQLQEELGLGQNLLMTRDREEEYPVERYFPSGRKIGRNERCPCGSGRKYKKCHGK